MANIWLDATYKNVILRDSPSLYWPLDERYGATDQSGNARNGTGNLSISIGTNAGSPVRGESFSTDFPAAGYVANTAYSPWVAGVSRTFEGWLNHDTNTGAQTIFGCNTYTGAPVQLAFQAGTANVFWSADNVELDTVGVWPSLGAWVHWALVFDDPADTVQLYLDGVAQTIQTHTATYNLPTGIHAGAVIGIQPVDGKMAHFAVYEYTLHADRILAHKKAGTG